MSPHLGIWEQLWYISRMWLSSASLQTIVCITIICYLCEISSLLFVILCSSGICTEFSVPWLGSSLISSWLNSRWLLCFICTINWFTKSIGLCLKKEWRCKLGVDSTIISNKCSGNKMTICLEPSIYQVILYVWSYYYP